MNELYTNNKKNNTFHPKSKEIPVQIHITELYRENHQFSFL